jgi:5-methylthioadenosine/S-adenosylhomocysteine deaminase
MKPSPIDPAVSAPLALAGRIVTMDMKGTVFEDGVVYARDGSIIAVQKAAAPPPAGFENVARTATGGTIFPGLIELHNHLPYGVLSLWQVPKKYGNRDQWSGPSTPDYHRLISGPMGVLGRNPDVVPAIVRYVEMRCLLGGTTTSQGVALASDPGIVTHFRGLIRNVESTGDPQLPTATTHIADVDATDADHFLSRISGTQKLILHLAEGADDAAHRHFKALHIAPRKWAITENLIGIHCVGLTAADFKVFGSHGGSMVWSPLSNLLLYGKTANVGAAIAAGVPIALGSDWAPSGSKNLLGELKVARLAAPAGVSAQDLVAMVTTTPARMLGWGEHLGSIESGKRADLIVVDATDGDPYETLLDATEAAVSLVVINGVPRCGIGHLMASLGLADGDQVSVAGRDRVLNLVQAGADPAVAALSVAESIGRLERALAALPTSSAPTLAGTIAPPPGQALLAVDGVIDNHMSSRPHLPYRGLLTGPNIRPALVAGVKPQAPLPALTLEPLTAVDNPAYYETLHGEANLPPEVRDGLFALAPTLAGASS